MQLEGEDLLDRSISQLLELGLTRNEAKLYLTLASTNEDSAGRLAKRAGINRIDTYRLLGKLAEKELVHVNLGRPARYRAVEPGTALGNLLRQKEAKMNSVRASMTDVSKAISLLRESSAKGYDTEATSQRSFYTLAYGRSSYLSDVTRMTRLAKTILCIVLTQNAMTRALMRATPDLWSTKSAEGLEIRMIVDQNSISSKRVRALSRRIDIRSVPRTMMRLTIFDDSSTLLCATDDVDLSVSSPSDVYLMTNDERFSRVMRLLFDHMWKNAKKLRR